MRNLYAILITTVIAMVTALGFCDAKADVQACVITVKDQAWVKGEKVCLKDIASTKGPAPQQERLGAIYLCCAPKPGMEKILRGTWIEAKVRSKRWLPENTVLRTPEIVRIGRTSQSIQEESFLRLYTGYISRQLKGRRSDFGVSRFKVINNGPLPEGDVRVELMNQAEGKLIGHVSLGGIIRVDGKIEQRVVLSGWVDRFEKVVCTAHRLQRHTLLAKDDLCLKRRNIAKLPANVIKAVEAVVGKRLKHTVKADAVLLANSVEKPPLIERGDRVTIIAESPTLMVTAIGTAQDRGSAGDQIRIKNCMSKKEIIARVVDASTVKVEF
ncbi:MAG: flagellar basal body P-ring formation protein FlgA [Desulfobacterales bacterium]|nr:flagellar basal body P-ring formation protein FlgA [Desulfobacterales bacterium]